MRRGQVTCGRPEVHGTAMSTAEQIVDIAQELVQKGGFQAFSYRDISARLGIRTASIHYYFPTKALLAEAVVNRVLLDFKQALDDIDTAAADPDDKLAKFCEIFLATFGEGDRLCPMCMLATGQETIPAPVRQGVREFWQGAESWLQALIETGQRQGRFRDDIVAAAASRAILASVEGGMVAARAMEDRTRMIDTIGFLRNGLARP